MLSFRLFGFPVHIQPFFWLIMAFIGGGQRLLSNPTTADLINVLVFMAAGFISILVHELGHAFMMRKYGRQPQIVLHGMGGVAMSSGAPLSRGQSIAMTFAGPLIQLVLWALAYFILKQVGDAGNFPTTQSYQFVYFLMKISFFWAVINLIPINPLDGGQILASLVGPKKQKLVHIIGIIIGLALIFFLYVAGYHSLWNFMIVGMLVWDNVKGLQRA